MLFQIRELVEQRRPFRFRILAIADPSGVSLFLALDQFVEGLARTRHSLFGFRMHLLDIFRRTQTLFETLDLLPHLGELPGKEAPFSCRLGFTIQMIQLDAKLRSPREFLLHAI